MLILLRPFPLYCPLCSSCILLFFAYSLTLSRENSKLASHLCNAPVCVGSLNIYLLQSFHFILCNFSQNVTRIRHRSMQLWTTVQQLTEGEELTKKKPYMRAWEKVVRKTASINRINRICTGSVKSNWNTVS